MVPHPRRCSFTSNLRTTPVSSSSTIDSPPKLREISEPPESPRVPGSPTSPSTGNQKGLPTIVDKGDRSYPKTISAPPCKSPATQPSTVSPIVAAFSRISPDKAHVVPDLSFAGLLNNVKPKPLVKTRSSPSLSTTGAWALEAKSRNRLTTPTCPFDFRPLSKPSVSSAVKPDLGFIPFRGQAVDTLTRVQCKPPTPSLFPNALCSSPSSPYGTTVDDGDEMKPLKGIFFGEPLL